MTRIQKKLSHAAIHITALTSVLCNAFPSIRKRNVATDSITFTAMTLSLAAIFGGSLSEALD